MASEALKKARDLVTRTEYGTVNGKKVVIATVYSSRTLGLEERVASENMNQGDSVGRHGSKRSAAVAAQNDEGKE